MNILKERTEAKNKRELASAIEEKEVAEKRIVALDKIIQNLYEDKVSGKLSEERFSGAPRSDVINVVLCAEL